MEVRVNYTLQERSARMLEDPRCEMSKTISIRNKRRLAETQPVCDGKGEIPIYHPLFSLLLYSICDFLLIWLFFHPH
jgi:hypothetical protein